MSAKNEPLANVGLVCEHRAPKPGKYAGLPAQQFEGKFVKMGFKARHPLSGRETIEHMWVKVVKVSGDSILGTLDNDPVFVTEPHVEHGDSVTLTVDQIEDVIES